MAYNHQLVNDMRKSCGGELTPAQRDAKNMQLHGLAITGGELARRAMIRNNMPMVLSVVDAYIKENPSYSKHRNDMVGEGFAKVTSTINGLRRYAHANPTQYIYKAVENCIKFYWRDVLKIDQQDGKQTYTNYVYTGREENPDRSKHLPEYQADDKADYDRDPQDRAGDILVSELDPIQAQVYQLRQDNKDITVREIAEKTGYSVGTVQNILWDIFYNEKYLTRMTSEERYATNDVNQEVNARLASGEPRPKQTIRPQCWTDNSAFDDYCQNYKYDKVEQVWKYHRRKYREDPSPEERAKRKKRAEKRLRAASKKRRKATHDEFKDALAKKVREDAKEAGEIRVAIKTAKNGPHAVAGPPWELTLFSEILPEVIDYSDNRHAAPPSIPYQSITTFTAQKGAGYDRVYYSNPQVLIYQQVESYDSRTGLIA